MKKLFKSFLAVALMVCAVFSFTGCKDKLDYQSVDAANVWEDTATALTTNSQVANETSEIKQLTIDINMSIIGAGSSNITMGVDLENYQAYVLTDMGLNTYIVNDRIYSHMSIEGFEESKTYIECNFKEAIETEIFGQSTADNDYSTCETYDEFKAKLLETLQSAKIEDEDLGDLYLGIEQISLTGKQYDDGRIGLVINTSVNVGDAMEPYYVDLTMEIISRNGQMTQMKTSVSGVSLTMTYKYGEFDSTVIPTSFEGYILEQA